MHALVCECMRVRMRVYTRERTPVCVHVARWNIRGILHDMPGGTRARCARQCAGVRLQQQRNSQAGEHDGLGITWRAEGVDVPADLLG